MNRRIAGFVWGMGLLVTGSVSTLATGQEKIELGMNIEPGESFAMELLIEQDINQKVMEHEIAMDQVIGMTMRFEVLDRPADHGGDWVEFTYTKMKFKQNGPMGGIDYDSDAPPADVPMAARGFAGLVGQQIRMEMSPEGEALQVEGVTEMLENILAAMDLPDGPAKQAAADAVKMQFNEESLKQMMSMSSAIYPPTPVAVGDSWDDTQSLGGMMPMKITSQYTLTEFDADTATLDMTATIGPNPDAEPFDINNTQVDAEMTGTQTGQIVVDRRTGWLRSSKVQQDMEGGMSMVMDNGGAMEIDMTIEGTVTMTLVE